jgi:hypothetical protein
MQVRGRKYLPLLIAFAVLVTVFATPALHVSIPGASGHALVTAAMRAMRSAAARAPALVDNQSHLYVLDGWGGVHPVGESPALATSASWPNRDIAFSLALFPDGSGGYVMDGWGTLHEVGSAPAIDSGVYWPNWVGAREIVMAPWSSSTDPAGYLLDADGNIHPFGGAPAVKDTTSWQGQDIARGLVLTPNATATSVMGYTLDAYGGIHPFGGAPAITGNSYWPGTDTARGFVLVTSTTATAVEGYTLDGQGDLHPFGGAPPVTLSADWPGQDMAASIVGWTGARPRHPGGWVLDRHGDVHAYGSAPALAASASWPGWDIARGLAGAGSGGGSTERLILDPEVMSDGWGTYYNQRDVRWASAGVGVATFPVWQVGCLLSDLAMVYSHFGNTSITPGIIASHSGWFDSRGAIFNSALNITGHSTIIKGSPDWPWISSQLAAGHPVIVGMSLAGGGTHFVTLTGLDGTSDYWTDDPWQQNGMHVTFSGDWPDRGPVYEAIAIV